MVAAEVASAAFPVRTARKGCVPLGRLALVEHGRELIAKLNAAISTMTLARGDRRFGRETWAREIFAESPRIILVASISGGAGSGMLLDAAYAVRKAAGRRGHCRPRLHGVLLHSTGRSPHEKLLARANSCACLRELHRFGGERDYPRDDDIGIPGLRRRRSSL